MGGSVILVMCRGGGGGGCQNQVKRFWQIFSYNCQFSPYFEISLGGRSENLFASLGVCVCVCVWGGCGSMSESSRSIKRNSIYYEIVSSI